MAKEFRIFYSWQSDLEGNSTRNFIGDAIDAASKFLANTVTVIPDRDTKDKTGSPNIEQTIFDKIDDSDLFIADLSIVTKYTDKNGKEKYSPNPNVLVELGYAVKVLGWENVICFINTDFGKESDLPFDLNHHRVTGYSLENKNKSDVRKNLRDIISSTIMTLMENGLRAREGFASHIVGSYDYEKQTVTEKLIPFDVQNSEFSVAYKQLLLEKAKSELEQILLIKLPDLEKNVSDSKERTDDNTVRNKGMEDKQSILNGVDFFQYKQVVISDSDKNKLSNKAKEYFNMDLDEEFFYLGDLEASTISLPTIGYQQRGSAEAKKKYDLIHSCIHHFSKLKLFEMYLKTFDGLLFFPMAIWNQTTTTDKDINISIVVDDNTAEVVIPDEHLIFKDISEIAGLVYEEDFLESLLKMPDTEDIINGVDVESQSRNEPLSNMPHIMTDPWGYGNAPQYDIEDYVYEIQDYIATPLELYNNVFTFHNVKLRPNEKNWLGKGILLRPKSDTIMMSYKITSECSNGNLEGSLEYIREI